MCAPVAADEEYWEYTFRPGDSIWSIAEKYTNSVNNWNEIQKINQIRQGPDRRIQPGTRILIPVSMLKQKPTPARVIALNGAAQLIRANGEKAELAIGTLLYSGDQLITLENQNLRIQFADLSELQVFQNSEVLLDKLSHHKKTGMVDTRIRLNSGSVETQVEKQSDESRYEISTPVAITAVRGTAFRMTSETNLISRTEVTEGVVKVIMDDTEQTVKEGFGIVAEKGKPLTEAVKLLPAPVIDKTRASNKNSLMLTWKRLQGASSYSYQLAVDEKFNLIQSDGFTENNSITVNGLNAAHYYFRVRGVDQYQLKGVDAVSDFIIEQKPVKKQQSSKDDTLRNITLPSEILLLNL